MELFNDRTFYKKNLKGLELFWQVLLPILIYLGATTIVSFIFPIVMGILGKIDLSSSDSINLFVAKYGMAITLISQIISLFILYFIYKKDERLYPKVSKKCNATAIIYGGLFVMSVGILSGYLMDLINYLFPSFGSSYEELENMLVSGGFVTVFLSTCILAPIVEEIMFRGLILNNLLSKRNVWYSIILSALLFGLIHMNLLQGTNAFILGIALAIVFVKTRNIYACMLGHFLNNFISIIGSYTNFPSITYDIINIVILIISIYPIIIFMKSDSVKIEKCD